MTIYDALPERRGISPVWEGRIAKDVTELDQLASVIIPDIDPKLRIEGAMWTPRPQNHSWSYDAPDTAWHIVGAAGEPPFQNGWSHYNPGTHPQARFRKDALGWVHLSGLIKGPTIDTVVFNLPVGFRPDQTLHLPGVGNATFTYIHVGYPGPGDVRMNLQKDWASLDDVSFFVGPDFALSDSHDVVMPYRGDPCLVIFDNDNRPWITVWWPYGS